MINAIPVSCGTGRSGLDRLDFLLVSQAEIKVLPGPGICLEALEKNLFPHPLVCDYKSGTFFFFFLIAVIWRPSLPLDAACICCYMALSTFKVSNRASFSQLPSLRFPFCHQPEKTACF